MKLKSYVNLIILALAIMFLSMNTVSANWNSQFPNTPCTDTSIDGMTLTLNDTYTGTSSGCGQPFASITFEGSLDTNTYKVYAERTGYYPVTNYWILSPWSYTPVNFTKEIGFNVSWDKSEYAKGETANIEYEFNITNFNNAAYYYELWVFSEDGTTLSNRYDLTQSSGTIQITFPEVGTYEYTLFVAPESDHNNGFYYDSGNYIIVSSLLNPQSFISWQYHTMDLGGVGTDGQISYGVSNSIWYFGSTISIEIFKNNNKVYSFDNLDNFGTVYYPLEEAGTYTAKLVLYVSYVGTVYKEDIAYVNLPQSYINTDKTEYYTNETIYFSGAKYPEPAETGKYYVLISTIQSVAGRVATYSFESKTPYTFSGSLNLPIGAYGVSLYGYSNQCVIEEQEICFRKKDTQEFVVKGLPDGSGKHFLNISWRKNESKLWDYAMLDYQNETSSDFITIYDNTGKFFRKWDFSSSTYSGSILVPQEPSYIGVWTARITNGSNISQYKEDTINIISASQQNFSNNYSIIMNWEKKENVKGNNKLTWNTGTYTGDYVLKLVNGITGVYLRTWEMETTNVKYNEMEVYLNGDIEQYTMQFISNNSKILASASIKIVESAEDTKNSNTDTLTEGGGQDGTYGTNWLNNILGFIGLPIFWGLVFICIVIYYLRNNTNLILPVLFIIINIEALVGLLDPYKNYIVVMTWLIVAINFIFVQRKATG